MLMRNGYINNPNLKTFRLYQEDLMGVGKLDFRHASCRMPDASNLDKSFVLIEAVDNSAWFINDLAKHWISEFRNNPT